MLQARRKEYAGYVLDINEVSKMKFAVFNSDNILYARYDTDTNSVIPDDAVELSDGLFWRTIKEKDGIWKRNPVSGEIYKEPLPPAPRTFYERIASDECTRRIETKWPQFAQANALDNVYGADGLAAMREWRDSHRTAYQAIIIRADLENIDIKSNAYWPA